MPFIIISKRNTASPWIKFNYLKSLGNSDLNFPTSGPSLPWCKYESIQLDLTWYMILHCCSLVYAGCCSLYMQLYVQIPCCSFVYAGCSSLWLRQYIPLPCFDDIHTNRYIHTYQLILALLIWVIYSIQFT